MARKASERNGNSEAAGAAKPAYRSFADYLAKLLADGVRATNPVGRMGAPWSPKEFGGADRNERTVRNYAKAVTRPEPADMRWIERKLFDPAKPLTEEQRTLRALWHEAGGQDDTPAAPAAPAQTPSIEAPERCWGRDAEVARLVAALTAAPAEGSVAVLVLGEGGIGKTTLKRHVAHHPAIQARFGPRIAEVALETADTGAQRMQDSIALAIGRDPKDGLDAVVKHLSAAAPHLLLLDNLETPWEAEPREVEALLRRLAAVKGLALVASLRGTEACRGADWEQCHLGPLPADEARRLFRRIAPRIAEDDPHLGDFLGELGGNPLAIRLVAERAQARADLAPLWREWQARGPAAAPDRAAKPGERHESLARSIEFSLASRRLDAAAHRLFRLLGALRAGMAREDRAALMGEEIGEAEDRLLRVGLAVERDGRLDLLPPVRRHATAAHPPAPEEQRAWVAHFLALTREQGERVGWEGGAAAAARLRPELANLDAAMAAAGDAGLLPEAVAAIHGYGQFGLRLGLGGDGLRALAPGCQAAGDRFGEAKCIKSLADIALRRSDHLAARQGYEAAMPIYREVGDRLGEAQCIERIADIALRRSDHAAARQGYEAAVTAYREIGDCLGKANCIRSLADIALRRSDHATARQGYEAAMPIFREVGDRLGEAICIRSLAVIALRRSDQDAARRGYEAAMPIYREVGDVVGEAACLAGLGELAAAAGDADEARRLIDRAIALCASVGSADNVSWVTGLRRRLGL